MHEGAHQQYPKHRHQLSCVVYLLDQPKISCCTNHSWDDTVAVGRTKKQTWESCLLSPYVVRGLPSRILFQLRAVITWFLETLRIRKYPEGNPDRPPEGTGETTAGGMAGTTAGFSLTGRLVITPKKKDCCWKTYAAEWEFTPTRCCIGHCHSRHEYWCDHHQRISKRRWVDVLSTIEREYPLYTWRSPAPQWWLV